MVCNAATQKLQWIDGSTITYTPKGSSDISFDCVNVHNTTVSMTVSFKKRKILNYIIQFYQDVNYWTNIQTDSSRMDTILCVTNDQEQQCGGYTLMDDAKIPKPCYKVRIALFFILQSIYIGVLRAAPMECCSEAV